MEARVCWITPSTRVWIVKDGYVSASVLPSRTHDAPAPGQTANMETSGFIGIGGWSLGVAW